MSRLYQERLAFLLILLVIVFGCLILSGTLFSGPRMEDENQIYKLQMEFEEWGFATTLKEELLSRFEMRRLVPLYCIQKVGLAYLFGTNLMGWHIYTGLLGVLSGFSLFLFAGELKFDLVASALFSLLSIVGEQSVLWWRLLQGEGIGLALSSVGLYLLTRGYARKRKRLEWLGLLFFLMASLCKESFILLLPAVGLFRLLLPLHDDENKKITDALGENRWYLVSVGVLFLLFIGTIKYGLGTTSFVYTGWRGYDSEQFARILGQYQDIINLPLLAALPLLVVIAFILSLNRREWTARKLARQLYLPASFFVLVTLPQLLLYMSSGFVNQGEEADYERYLIPCLLGIAFLTAVLLNLTKTAVGPRPFYVVAVALLSLQLVLKTQDAYGKAEEYAAYVDVTGQWFEAIAKNVESNEDVVIVFINGERNREYAIQAALRVYYIMNQGYGYEKIYFSPLPDRPTIEEARLHLMQRDTRYFAQRMRAVDEIRGKKGPGGIMVLNWGKFKRETEPVASMLEGAFIAMNRGWIDFQGYGRTVNGHGHITYVRKREP
jgi:hypothetical protein